MAEEQDHICSGVNCIFCQIAATDEVSTYASGLTILTGQGLARLDPPSAITSNAITSGAVNLIESTKDQARQLEQLEKLAFYDQLTGLFNVHVFLRELKEEIARAQRYKRPLSIAALCIDNYEEVKAKYGPLGRELILKHVGGLLQDLLREVDVAARMQSDQFAIILPETNEAGARIVGERIRAAFTKRPAKLNALTLNITPSIGIAAFPRHGQDIDALLDSCINAQATALSNGGNRVHVL